MQRRAIDGRFDSIFYKSEFREIIEKINKKNSKQLSNLIHFSRETWNGKDFFEDKFPYIEISKIDTFLGIIKKISYIKKEEAPSRAKMIVRNKDIIVSTTRPNRGAISYVLQDEQVRIASTGFAILRDLKSDKVLKEYLFYCLRQSFSSKQLEQRSSGGNYPAITVEELKKIRIPIPPLEKQQEIVKLFQNAYQQKQEKEAEAKRLLESIDAYLLEKLGIELPQEKESKKIFFTSLKAIQGKRFDPFYHKTEFEELELKIVQSKYKTKSLRKILTFLESGSRPSGGVSSYKEGILSLGGEHVNYKCEIEVRKPKFIPLKYHEKHLLTETKMNDILLVKDGATTGKIGIITDLKYTNQNVNEHVFILRFDEVTNSFFVINLLATSFYQKMISRIITGATVTGLTKDVIRNLQIPLPPLEVQDEIAAYISDLRSRAKELEKEAKDILKSAKKEVEKMILGE